MPATEDQIAALGEPTPPEEIKKRPAPGSKNKMLDYIDARFVMDRFDSAVGVSNWQDEYRADPQHVDGIVGRIGVHTEDGWVWKEDVGTESSIEGTKGSYSDAFKRAAVKWGCGRDLYAGPVVVQRAGVSTTEARASSGKPRFFVVSEKNAPWVCPDHHGVVAWPAGTSGSGKKYDAFYACPKGRECSHRPPRGTKVKPEHMGGKASDTDALPF